MVKIEYKKSNLKKRRELLDKIIPIAEDYLAKGYQITVRQMFYQLVTRGMMNNTYKDYKKTGEILKDGRLFGEIDWDLIVDRGRQPIEPPEYESISDVIRAAKNSYRNDRWKRQEYYVEVLVEKDALAGILEPIVSEYHVRLLADKGYPSISSMHDLANRIRKQVRRGKKCVILYMGDHDPSGLDMVTNIPKQMENLKVIVAVKHIALTKDQVQKYNLLPQYAKKGDSRHPNYKEKHGQYSWELDALDTGVLRDILRTNIKKYLDEDLYRQAIEMENEDKDKLERIADDWENL